ncbi:MAG TPA: HAMP domain-containing sensor histidine kinase [Polyangiaceae bacterium]|nr:HAMP domain-containing sensor histidine kinase [Polyangiaceae bacterium]
MKLVPKLTLALVFAMCGVLALNGYFRVKREIGYVEADRIRDHEMVGRALGAAFSAIWSSEGRASAMHVIDEAQDHFSMTIRWIDAANVPVSCGDLWVDSNGFASASTGTPQTRQARGDKGAEVHTCVPIDSAGLRQGAIELIERLPQERPAVWAAVKDAAFTAVAIASVSALLSLLLGFWLVGRPVNALVEKARRIGRGDFSGPIHLHEAAEFAVLAKEMNAMCGRLVSILQQLRHADRLATVGKLASGIAHELGTPLNVISARAAMIASGEALPDETADYARVIAGAAHRMTSIIRQLLQFARKKETQKARRDVRSLVRDAVELLRPLSEKQRVTLVIDPAAADVDTTADVDAAQLEQVITNLVMNAIQAMPQGGTVNVSVGRQSAYPPWQVEGADTQHLCIRIRDEGEGIAPEHLPHIFEPFYTTKGIGEGTGLGLSVSFGIIEEHRGWITVESKVNSGSHFSVFLPLTPEAS